MIRFHDSPRVFAMLTTLFMVGCGGNWQTVEEGMPWCAPGERLVEQSLEKPGWNTNTYEVRWRDHQGAVYRFPEIGRSIESYLEQVGHIAALHAQPQRKEGTGPLLTTVSINPLVVLMTPWDVSDSPREAPELTPKGCKAGYWPDNSLVLGPFAYGSQAWCNGPVQWMSPDLDQPPTDIAFSQDGEAEIRLPDGKLRLLLKNKLCHVTRE